MLDDDTTYCDTALVAVAKTNLPIDRSPHALTQLLFPKPTHPPLITPYLTTTRSTQSKDGI